MERTRLPYQKKITKLQITSSGGALIISYESSPNDDLGLV